MAETEHSSSDQFLQDDSTISSSSDKRVNKEESRNLEFSEDEDTLIKRMFNLVGERWSLIAGRIPGRSADEIEKYWRSTNS